MSSLKSLAVASLVALLVALGWGLAPGLAATPDDLAGQAARAERRITQSQREAAAARLKAARQAVEAKKKQQQRLADPALAAPQAIPLGAPMMDMPMPMPGGTPDYFGVANWAYTPPLRKFVDGLPGLGATNANALGQYLPVAVADKTTYPGSDYYEIEVRQYTEKMHSDLPPTTLRGYVQVKNGVDVAPIHYLGPIITAEKDRPVRLKFTNKLPTGAGGNLFIPVDTTVMGAGMGPLMMEAMPMHYTQNRATLHLHGGRTPWISDGTAHQWITPAGEMTPYRKGVSARNVPDMPDPGPGAMTFYWTNQQSARLMFFHDHSYGITRLNVLVGEVAFYLITDQAEKDLVNAALIPAEQIPLIIQDKTFVDAPKIRDTDPMWNWGTGAMDMATGIRAPKSGDIWLPHVYVPAQNPFDETGVNPYGRWAYGPWFWPPTTDIKYGPVPNPYYDPDMAPWQPPEIPGTPHPSMGMESFFDTPLVNGTAYPTLTVQPKSYRFRILNAANDRFWNLQLYRADPAVISADGRTMTEVRMVPAIATEGFPETWPTDGRDEGVPDPAMVGPSFIQIGTEGGFLPMPAVVENQPITWNRDPTTFNAGNVEDHALVLGPAERADVIVDFSAYAGQTLILYNDAPAAYPARDARLDYYTGSPDLSDTGGYTGTPIGYGPNTRTIMQIKVAAAAPAAPFDLAALQAAFRSTPGAPGVFAKSQEPIVVAQPAYNETYNQVFPRTYPLWGLVRIQDTSMTFRTLAGGNVTMALQPKAIQDEMGEAFDTEYGRMSGFLGLEVPNTTAGSQRLSLYAYSAPPVEILTPSISGTQIGVNGDGTQIWKITHNGVDTHPIHFHLFDVQLLNRVGWDGAIRKPDANELGWKDTVRVSPLEDTIVAFRPILPTVPFKLPNSIRLMDPTMPEGTVMFENFPQSDPAGNPVGPIVNHYINYGHEYMWHCHILSHEEMDMMHSIVVAVTPEDPTNLVATPQGGAIVLSWIDNSLTETEFTIERAEDPGFTVGVMTITVPGDVTTFVDDTLQIEQMRYYRVFASNIVGDTTVYQNSIGFPNKQVDSGYSNVVLAGVPREPAAPTNLSATVIGPRQVDLTWVDNSDNELGFQIERATGNGAFAVVAVAAQNATTFSDTTAPDASTLRYQVSAVNGKTSPPSNIVTVTTALAAPTGLAAAMSPASPLGVVLTWTNNSVTATNFTVQRATNAAFTANVVSYPLGVAETYTNTSNVTANATYFYRVQGRVGGTTSDWTNTVSIVAAPQMPTAPTGLGISTTPAGPNVPVVTLNWTDNSNNELSFTIQRATNATFTAGLKTLTAAADATSFADTPVAALTTYYYRVRAVNGAGNSAWSNTVTIRTSAQPPLAPTNLVLVGFTATSITIGWTDNSTNESGFEIERSTNGTSGWSRIVVTAPNRTSYTNTGLSTNRTYYYRVRAANASGKTEYTNIISGRTQ